MARSVDRNSPLSDDDRAYLLSRGQEALVDDIDRRFAENVEEAPETGYDPLGGEEDDEEGDPAYEEWPVEELKEELRRRELAVSGKQAELAARLRQHDAQQPQ